MVGRQVAGQTGGSLGRSLPSDSGERGFWPVRLTVQPGNNTWGKKRYMWLDGTKKDSHGGKSFEDW